MKQKEMTELKLAWGVVSKALVFVIVLYHYSSDGI
jgi:hypothetical protein